MVKRDYTVSAGRMKQNIYEKGARNKACAFPFLYVCVSLSG
jgi:hypothetical protein